MLPSRNRRLNRGFSLIELMIVVAIIAVVSAIAVPSYRDYVAKSQLTAGIAVLKGLTAPAELYVQQNGALNSNSDLAMLGIKADSSRLGTLSIEHESLVFRFHSPDGAIAILSRDETTGWQCHMTLPHEMDNSLKPVSCL
ncbi:pilin [Vibrio porteresiae]|uniref:Prepilin-type N-terminal cleavage/methylation domain-containing protein n=1 Tax=Vibrio porteresiae DSM 19223 TaxID=1123496 RepID=A0ABZ0QB66_9VIBR|nr:prepilin-type N-terminal cleavage/methylation domain-containing protein [Vibrio porteresiae]WPC73679.1 prepilin-type N-terminal cleavage/methylation domain-containing protein [Vibrio porteresiae DSM 19223]